MQNLLSTCKTLQSHTCLSTAQGLTTNSPLSSIHVEQALHLFNCIHEVKVDLRCLVLDDDRSLCILISSRVQLNGLACRWRCRLRRKGMPRCGCG